MRICGYFLFDVQNLAIHSNVKSPTARVLLGRIDDAIGGCNFLLWVTEDRVIELETLGKSRILVDGIAAGGKVGDVECEDLVAARTERLAFLRSAAGEGFGEPRENNCLLALEIRQLMHHSVAALERKVWRIIARLQLRACGIGKYSRQKQAHS